MVSGYVGRFAPSPTGPLHFGSLVAALASFLDARAAGGRWLLRMEDLDPPREVPGAADLILRQLRLHGLEWDGDVLYQSQRSRRYEEIIDELLTRGVAYHCDCSRQRVQQIGGIYDGHCFGQMRVSPDDAAIRVHIPPQTMISFEDHCQGPQRQDLNGEVGDFVIRRRDGYYAYQLAVVVDDWEQGVTQIVRGSDLLDSTARQIWLMSELGAAVPSYFHLPVVINDIGQKLSKQNLAPSLDLRSPLENLELAVRWLGLPDAAEATTCQGILARAVSQWSRAGLVGSSERPAPPVYLTQAG